MMSIASGNAIKKMKPFDVAFISAFVKIRLCLLLQLRRVVAVSGIVCREK